MHLTFANLNIPYQSLAGISTKPMQKQEGYHDTCANRRDMAENYCEMKIDNSGDFGTWGCC